MQTTMYLLLNFIIIALIAFIMEVYKKVIRKDNYSKYECWGIGLFLSMLGVLILRLTGTMKFVFNSYLNAYLWVDYILYVIGYYFVQFKFDMGVIKKLFKSILKTLLDKTNLTEEQKDIVLDKLTTKKE